MHDDARRAANLSVPTIPAPMYRIEATPTAAAALAKASGLRARVEEVLTGILETAAEIRRMQDGFLAPRPDQFLRVRVSDHMISYALDLEKRTAKVVFVERVPDRDEGDESSVG